MPTPQKPFPKYKWRWADVVPSEGLNEPPIYLGVLRALEHNEGNPPSSTALANDLQIVQDETKNHLLYKSRVNLVGTGERNLIRRQGRYWKALGLLEKTDPRIKLTDFGKRVARGGITKDEFAATTIKTLSLPNRRLEEDTSDWDNAGLEIKPLELILNIASELCAKYGAESSYITKEELIQIVIPLAGENSRIERHVKAINAYRRGQLDISQWPDCAPRANDSRMAREYLLFLAHYGYCKRTIREEDHQEIFIFDPSIIPELEALSRISVESPDVARVLDEVRKGSPASMLERQRKLMEVLTRPGQTKFRRNVLAAYENSCLLTGEDLPEVLQACHIIPVPKKGSDTVENGFCLRADIHLLYDAGNIKISPEGNITLSEATKNSKSYRSLPRRILIPGFVSKECVEWRFNYY